MQTIKKIAVIGGTGKSGQYLVQQLVEKNLESNVLIRKPGAEKGLSGVHYQLGDASDYASVFKLLKGCDALISTLGQRKEEPPVHIIANNNILRAMKELNIRRYILVTGLSIDVPGDRKGIRTKLLSYFVRKQFPTVFEQKQAEYALISESELDWTIVRVPAIQLTDVRKEINISMKDCPGKSIGAGNLAAFLIQQLSDTRYLRKAPFVSD